MGCLVSIARHRRISPCRARDIPGRKADHPMNELHVFPAILTEAMQNLTQQSRRTGDSSSRMECGLSLLAWSTSPRDASGFHQCVIVLHSKLISSVRLPRITLSHPLPRRNRSRCRLKGKTSTRDRVLKGDAKSSERPGHLLPRHIFQKCLMATSLTSVLILIDRK
jgi:hypothetical protein